MAQNRTAISFGERNIGLQVGQSLAPISAEIHLPPDRPETPPRPSSNVPFRRDPDFVDRPPLLDQLHQKCSAPAARIALVGLGGVGKSQLAIEYAYQVRCQSPETWIFWVHASNAARFEQSYREIADRVRIPQRQDPQADIFQLVHDWLRDETNGRWLLVLDNADDTSWLVGTQTTTSQAAQAGGSPRRPTQALSAYLPQSHNGSILVTTRTRDVALKLVEDNDIIPVEPMDEGHALSLFEKKLPVETPAERMDMAELAAALDFMPLAIVQAAAYIKQRTLRCSVRQYIEKFQKTDREKTKLLSYEAGNLRRDWAAKNSIIITWHISFDYIHQVRPSAADLLSLMSFFDRQGILEALLRSRGETGSRDGDFERRGSNNEGREDEDSRSESSTNDEFEDDILTLRNYSFIFVNVDTMTFEMHRLVQVAMQNWLVGHGQLERWKQQYITNLCTEFPPGSYENWTKCRALFPHAKSALTQRPKEENSLGEWASLLYKAASYAWQSGNLTDAENMSVKYMEVREMQLGQEDEETLRSMTVVGAVYLDWGLWKEAEALQIQVMEITKRVLGTEHPGTLTSMNNLAVNFWNQGSWTEATALLTQVLEISQRVQGVEHPETLMSMSNLASTFLNQGRLTEAEVLEVQAMEISQRVLGAEHPHTLLRMHNLALTWKDRGRDADARKLMEQCVAARTQILGANHPSTVKSCAALNQWHKE